MILKEFVIYLGTGSVVTVSSKGLSKVYRLEYDKPVLIENEADRMILLSYEENVQNGCCGGTRKSRPVMTDVTYCQYRKLDLLKFRDEMLEKQTYKCQCLDCGKVFNSKKHCQDSKCPKCGGKNVRRRNRPGAGKTYSY